MDAFLNSFHDLCETLLPILAAFVLVLLMVLLLRYIAILKHVEKSVEKLPHTIDLVDMSLQKVQYPLDTVARISRGVDKLHDDTIDAINKAKDAIVRNYEEIKAKVSGKKKDEDKELKEPSPEDLIGD